MFFNIREYANKISRKHMIIEAHTYISIYIWYKVWYSRIVSSWHLDAFVADTRYVIYHFLLFIKFSLIFMNIQIREFAYLFIGSDCNEIALFVNASGRLG